MPFQDSYAQGIEFPALTDQPNVDNIKEALDAVVRQTVLRFDSAAARNATLTDPQAGDMAWLRAEKLLTEYDGTQWTVVAAGSQKWTKIALNSGFTHNGNSNGDLSWRRVNLFGEPTVMLKGAINVTYDPSIPHSGVITQSALPSSAWPSTLRTVTIPCSDVNSTRITLKLDAKTDGHLEIYGTNSSNNRPIWIGFNGVYYPL